MNDDRTNPGAIPSGQRKLMVVSCAIIFVLMIGTGLLLNTLSGSPIDWFWLIVAPVVITGLIASWFWFRLSK